jgi:Ricin-type beta-trefoil lectin domain-like
MKLLKSLSVAVIVLCACVAALAADASGPAASKSYQIRNKKYGDLLRPRDANSANGTPLVLYPAEPWKCMTWKLSSAGESRFFLQNHFTSKTFSPKAGEEKQAAVAQVPFGKSEEERPAWQFTKLADGTYKITDAKTGNALTAVKPADSSARIVVQPWEDSDAQKWELIEIDPKTLTM